MIETLTRDAVFAIVTAGVFLAFHLLVWNVLPRVLPKQEAPGPKRMLLAIWSFTVALCIIATIRFIPHGTDLQLGAVLVMLPIGFVFWLSRGSRPWRNAEAPREKGREDRDYEAASAIGLALGLMVALFVEL